METVQYLPILPCSLQKNLLLLDTSEPGSSRS